MEPWVGVAHVKPKPGNDLLEDAPGAFVAAVGLAQNENEFVAVLSKLLQDYEFETVEIKDVGTLEDRKLCGGVDKTICELAMQLSEDNRLLLSTFHTYN